MKEERIRSRTGKKQIFFFHENIQDLKEYSLQTNMKSKEHQFFLQKQNFLGRECYGVKGKVSVKFQYYLLHFIITEGGSKVHFLQQNVKRWDVF